jgi:hypothetical protein
MRTATSLAVSLALAASLNACASAQSSTLASAEANYPPLIIGANVIPATGAGPFPRPCPPAGSRVEQKGGPTVEYLGIAPGGNDALCRIRMAGETADWWYGLWVNTWAGGDAAYVAMRKTIHGKTGDIAGFDTDAGPGLRWHDCIRNEGIERISLLGKTYTALKLSHYREGYDGNIYRSVGTVWIDMDSGMIIYGTYDHISGRPEIETPLIPTAIVPAR